MVNIFHQEADLTFPLTCDEKIFSDSQNLWFAREFNVNQTPVWKQRFRILPISETKTFFKNLKKVSSVCLTAFGL